MLSSIADLSMIAALVINGILMSPLSPLIVLGVYVAAIVLAIVLDQMKLAKASQDRLTEQVAAAGCRGAVLSIYMGEIRANADALR